MSFRQWLAIALCCTMIGMDGYDIIAVTFAMPGIAKEWGISRTLLGLLFSTGIVGMAAGCLLLGPLADKYGRRRTAICGLLVMMTSMAFSALVPAFSQLIVWRAITGAGVGAIAAVAYPLAVEYSNLRARPIALAGMVISFPLGSAVCGILASHLIAAWGWRAAFVPGIILPPLIVVCSLRWLPEPLGLLIERPTPLSLKRANAYLRWAGRPPVDYLPRSSHIEQASIGRVLGREFGRTTAYLTAIYCLYSLTAYFILAWLTQITVDRGFSASVAASVSVATNVGGCLGAAATALAIRKCGVFRVLLVLLLGMAAAVTAIGLAPANITILRGLGVVAGVGVFGPIVGLTLLIAERYPVEVRATGTGFIIGTSRWVAALGPLIGGALMSSTLGVVGSCLLMAVSALASAGLLALFNQLGRVSNEDCPFEAAQKIGG